MWSISVNPSMVVKGFATLHLLANKAEDLHGSRAGERGLVCGDFHQSGIGVYRRQSSGCSRVPRFGLFASGIPGESFENGAVDRGPWPNVRSSAVSATSATSDVPTCADNWSDLFRSETSGARPPYRWRG